MQDFDSLKNLWQQPENTGNTPLLKPLDTNNHSATLKMKLQKEQWVGALMLMITAVLISLMAIFGNFNFVHWYTYGAMALIVMICLAQATILLMTYKKIKKINDTAIPSVHLQQWEQYYAFRKKQVQWNMPLYFIFLNIAMCIYFIEIFSGRPVVNVLILLAVFFGWMLFSYFYIGKRKVRKENNRLQQIIDNLKAIEEQLSKDE